MSEYFYFQKHQTLMYSLGGSANRVSIDEWVQQTRQASQADPRARKCKVS
jgi:hypothetical protein